MKTAGFIVAFLATLLIIFGVLWAVVTLLRFLVRLFTRGDPVDLYFAPHVIAGFLWFLNILLVIFALVFTPLGLVAAVIIGIIGTILGC